MDSLEDTRFVLTGELEKDLGLMEERRPTEDLPGEDLEAEDLDTNLDNTVISAEAKTAAVNTVGLVESSVTSSACLLSSLSSLPPIEA